MSDGTSPLPPELAANEEWTDEARVVFSFWGEPNAREEGFRTNIMMIMVHPTMAMACNKGRKYLLMAN